MTASALALRGNADLDTFLAAHAVLSREGHDELHFGHLSFLDRERGLMWIKQGDISFGAARDHGHLQAVDLDGNRVVGDGITHSEIWLHLGIYRAREDVQSIAHSHAPLLAAYSALPPSWQVIDQYSLEMGLDMAWHDSSRLVVTPELGDALARDLGEARTCFLRSHGAVVADISVEAATVGIVELGRAVRNLRLARSLGDPVEMAATDREALGARFAQRKASRVANMWGQLCAAQLERSARKEQ